MSQPPAGLRSLPGGPSFEGSTQGRKHPFELGIIFLILSGALVLRALHIQSPLGAMNPPLLLPSNILPPLKAVPTARGSF